MTGHRLLAIRRTFRGMGLILGAGLMAAPGLANAGSLDLFYERTVMTAADARCGLFSPPVGSALASARVQARGAALRGGAAKADLIAIDQRARAKAQAIACDAPDLELAAGRVRQAFEGYARMLRMDYPGDHADWRADRSTSATAVRWRLTQDQRQGGDRLMFGLAGREGVNALMAVVQLDTDQAPNAARLVMRDDAATAGPYLDRRGASLAATPLSRRLSPPGAQAIFQAEARSPAGRDLLAKDMTNGWAFRFPQQAARALAALDPREAIAIDFLFQDDSTRRIYVEVGDFAAGRAFLQVASR